jgi:hypothetical protein
MTVLKQFAERMELEDWEGESLVYSFNCLTSLALASKEDLDKVEVKPSTKKLLLTFF